MKQQSDKLLTEASEEKFSITNASIIFGMHLIALPAFYFFSFQALICFFVFHFIFECLGVSIGYHKLIAHKAFDGPVWFKNVLYTLATLCFQGGPVFWAAVHRTHHIFSDEFGDPHSSSRGFFWSHMGWLLYKNPNGFSYKKAKHVVVADLNSKYVRFLEHYHLQINLGFILFGLVTLGIFLGRWDLFFWLFPMRIVAVWHCVWLVNSYTHCAPPWLRKKYGFQIINSVLCSCFMYGDGYHYNHHQRPTGICNIPNRPYLDFSYVTLRVLAFAKLVTLRSGSEERSRIVA